ncbi:ABC transporter permease subunit [Rhodospirillaceae bacterium SYSU D60014]|uniref:ABC transporter permease n=1 Tax=Virgifigura deserti TaxID=2268457 RepID=UPI000E67182B
MTAVPIVARRVRIPRQSAGRNALLLALAIVGSGVLLRDLLPWTFRLPDAWVVPVADWITALFNWLGYSADLGLFTFRDLTRGIAWLLAWPLSWADGILYSGFPAIGLPQLPWIVLVLLITILGHAIAGWRLALLAGGCVSYLTLFGVWRGSMQTLSIIVITVPLAAATGLALGILATRNRRAEAVLTGMFDLMQSIPHFAYLVPVVVLFGFGDVPAMIATGIFAMPPMARCTILGLRTVPSEVIESGRMSGCTPRQLLWKVQLPAARSTLMVGVNQVIMQTLAMAVIASLIGASGLGFDLLYSLQSLKLGQALEQGVAIVVMAIVLDRLSQAYARKQPVRHRHGEAIWHRHAHAALAVAVLVVGYLLSAWAPALRILPSGWAITTAPFWDAIVEWISLNLYGYLGLIRDGLLVNVLIPVRNLFLGTPWTIFVGLVALLGYRLGGWRLSLLVAALIGFIVITGFWTPAMITVYLVSIAVVICTGIGVPLGIWAARKPKVASVVLTICDTMQTFPSFIYLIPVVMLFKVGDVAAITAIIAYAMVPAIRYSYLGLRRVPTTIVESAVASGCTRRQILWKVELPLALPEIMLGVNQTIMMGLFMVTITALIGTRDLGQEINKALTDADTGRGLVAGLCIAFIGITADRLIGAWSLRRKRQLGLA